MRSVVIAAPASGSGKTTLTVGIMHALAKRGLRVAPFKVGPDFIDPGYHRLATGAASVNLDSWMCPAEFVRDTFDRHASNADIAVIEGVMGLFDGIDGATEAGSTAEVAKLVGAPVVLVVDASRQGRSAAAVVHGFAVFDPDLPVRGVIFNNVASENHERILRDAVAGLAGIAVVGCFPRDASLAIPSRHLGLITAEDNPLPAEYLAALAEQVERHLDLDLLLSLVSDNASGLDSEVTLPSARSPRPLRAGARERELARARGWGKVPSACLSTSQQTSPSPTPPRCTRALARNPARGGGVLSSQGGAIGATVALDGLATQTGDSVRIAVARDAAFCFVYQDNLRLLAEAGADLVEFSPLADAELPEEISGIYLPGGYPELFRDRLAANVGMKKEIREAVEAGMPVYAECGGFIYLTRGVAEEGTLAEFVGLFPVATRMLPRRKALGYREVELLSDAAIGKAGTRARGHEFHYSEMEPMPVEVERVYRLEKKGIELGPEGYRYKNCLASYVHLHLGSAPGVAEQFVEACRAHHTRSRT